MARTEGQRTRQMLWMACWYGLLLAGVFTCGICDLAVTGAWTWSRLPIGAMIFAGLVCDPLVRLGGKGLWRALASLSVLLLPFLYGTGSLLGQADAVMGIGGGPAVISLLFLWSLYAVFRLLHGRKLLAWSIAALLAAILCMAVNWSLADTLGVPQVDVWDAAAAGTLLTAALTLFLLDSRRNT